MAWPVVTVAAGGIPVIDVTATKPLLGAPVTEATRGTAVTKVAAGGIAVTFVNPPLLREGDDNKADRSRTGKVARR